MQIGLGGASLSQSRLPTPTPRLSRCRWGCPRRSVSVKGQLLKEIKSPPLPVPNVQALGSCPATSQTRSWPPRKEGLDPAMLRALPRATRLNPARDLGHHV